MAKPNYEKEKEGEETLDVCPDKIEVKPLGEEITQEESVGWSDVDDDNGKKPTDNADETADNNNWSEVNDDDTHKPDDDADVTGDNTADDTDNVNSQPALDVQERAENDYIRGVFRGNDNDELTETVTNATIYRLLINTKFVQSTGGYWKLLTTTGLGYKTYNGDQYDWDNDFEFYCKCAAGAGANGNGTLAGGTKFWGLWDGGSELPSVATSGDENIAVTERHIGFFISAQNKLFASSADGSTQETTEITGITHTNENDYRIVHDAGTNVKFYVNDVLKATHSTNIPAGSTNPPDVHFQGRIGLNTTSNDFLLFNNYKIVIT